MPTFTSGLGPSPQPGEVTWFRLAFPSKAFLPLNLPDCAEIV